MNEKELIANLQAQVAKLTEDLEVWKGIYQRCEEKNKALALKLETIKNITSL